MKSILTAIYSKFTTKVSGSYVDFYDAVSGRMYLNEAPEGTTFPYAVYYLISDTQERTFSTNFEDCLIQFSIFSEARHDSEVLDAADDLFSLYDDCSLTISDYQHLWMLREFHSLDRVDDVWQLVVQYRLMAEKT